MYYFILKVLNTKTLVVCNVYGTRNSNDCMFTWRFLNEHNIKTLHYMLGGDLNNLEIAKWMSPIGPCLMHRCKTTNWNRMTI
jgi:hypothetical protein